MVLLVRTVEFGGVVSHLEEAGVVGVHHVARLVVLHRDIAPEMIDSSAEDAMSKTLLVGYWLRLLL